MLSLNLRIGGLSVRTWDACPGWALLAKGLATLVKCRLLWLNPGLPSQEELEWRPVPCQVSSQDQAQDYGSFSGTVGESKV